MTTIIKLPAPEAYTCLWCKKDIPAGEKSLLVEIDGTKLYSCMECGGHVKITKKPTLRDRTLSLLEKKGGPATSRTVAESLGMDEPTAPNKASTALCSLWREGRVTRTPRKTTSGSLVYEYTLAFGESDAG